MSDLRPDVLAAIAKTGRCYPHEGRAMAQALIDGTASPNKIMVTRRDGVRVSVAWDPALELFQFQEYRE